MRTHYPLGRKGEYIIYLPVYSASSQKLFSIRAGASHFCIIVHN